MTLSTYLLYLPACFALNLAFGPVSEFTGVQQFSHLSVTGRSYTGR